MSIYIFGYGSLLNPRSRAQTFSSDDVVEGVVLNGYQRKMNAPYDGYLYMNLVPNTKSRVLGVLVRVPLEDFDALKERELGYECVDVSQQVDRVVEQTVYAFIAPDVSYPELTIPQTYIDTCLAGVPKDMRNEWLAETIIENKVVDDRKTSIYEFVDQDSAKM